LQAVRERGVELRVAREDFRIKRRQRDVVKREADLAVRGEKLVRRLVERVVEMELRVAAMSENACDDGGFGKKNSAASVGQPGVHLNLIVTVHAVDDDRNSPAHHKDSDDDEADDAELSFRSQSCPRSRREF
jgi:hypothetical protein